MSLLLTGAGANNSAISIPNPISIWPRNGNCTDVVSGNNGTDTNVTYGT